MLKLRGYSNTLVFSLNIIVATWIWFLCSLWESSRISERVQKMRNQAPSIFTRICLLDELMLDYGKLAFDVSFVWTPYTAHYKTYLKQLRVRRGLDVSKEVLGVCWDAGLILWPKSVPIYLRILKADQKKTKTLAIPFLFSQGQGFHQALSNICLAWLVSN